MTKWKRHSQSEIAIKLAHAEALIAQGQRQQEVARSLGVSVMTFHRWRKSQPLRRELLSATTIQPQQTDQTSQPQIGRIAELQLENARLRRLVTDLLLEKIKLEESESQLKPGSNPVGLAAAY